MKLIAAGMLAAVIAAAQPPATQSPYRTLDGSIYAAEVHECERLERARDLPARTRPGLRWSPPAP
jgi:hypothetical protein